MERKDIQEASWGGREGTWLCSPVSAQLPAVKEAETNLWGVSLLPGKGGGNARGVEAGAEAIGQQKRRCFDLTRCAGRRLLTSYTQQRDQTCFTHLISAAVWRIDWQPSLLGDSEESAGILQN